MKFGRLAFVASMAMAATLACAMPGGQPPPTATMFVLPTPNLTQVFAESTPFGTQVTEPTQIPATVPPTTAPTEPIATPTGIIAATQPSGGVDRVQVFLIALEDDGSSGEEIGCGDSVVPVEREIAPTQAPLRAALEELLGIKDQFYGQSGLYNSLYQSDLAIDRVVIENGKATVELSGQVLLAGECDNPRFEAQLMKTILQFSTVTSADVFINGRPLSEIISLQG